MIANEWKNQRLYSVSDDAECWWDLRFHGIHWIDCRLIADKMITNEHLAGIPLLLLANKQDLPDCMGVREIKPVFQQSAIHIGRRDCLVMPVSALTGEGVQEGIQWLVEAILRHSVVRLPRVKD